MKIAGAVPEDSRFAIFRDSFFIVDNPKNEFVQKACMPTSFFMEFIFTYTCSMREKANKVEIGRKHRPKVSFCINI